MALPTYIPISDAARKYGYKVAELRKMAESGKIDAVQLPDGDVVVSENTVKNTLRKEDLPEYRRYKHLAGVEIGITEAAGKYEIPQQTISRWVQRGFISRLGQDGRKVLIDEQDVAYCANIYEGRKGQGKWLFNPNGTPYLLKAHQEQLPEAA